MSSSKTRQAPKLEVLQEPGKKTHMLGNTAIARGALEAGLQFFSCYPGTPSTEIADTLAQAAPQADLKFEYSINEKAAVETAFGAALSGARSMCSMKHVGLSSAADPIGNMPYVGVEGGMVIVSAGDPSALTSSNEQDQRHLTRMLFFPIFDPATPEDALKMTRYAFGFSEETRLPVIMRPTTRVCHGSGMMDLGPLPKKRNEIKFVKNPPRHVPIPPNARRMRVELTGRYAKAEKLLGESAFFPRTGKGKKGIIASGVATAYVRQVLRERGWEDEFTLQQIGAYPIPEKIISEFLKGVESVLVVEELTPFVEDWLTQSAYRAGLSVPISGKHSGHFPMEFEYDPDLVEKAIRKYAGKPERKIAAPKVPELPPRPPVLCAGCPHRNSFLYSRRIFGKDTVHVNDIGCYTLSYGEPLDCCDVLLSMGSGITMASGIARTTGKRTVAYIGDSTFFHSGMPGLLNALQADDEITIVILNNEITAMTGFQPSPKTSIEAVVRGLGVKEIYSVDPFDEKATMAAFRKAKAGKGVNVVVCNSPCILYEEKSPNFKSQTPFTIDQEACTQCTLCVRALGCPAILVIDGKYTIERGLCTGCSLCAELCRKDAILREDQVGDRSRKQAGVGEDAVPERSERGPEQAA